MQGRQNWTATNLLRLWALTNARPLMPSVATITLRPSPRDLYIFGLTYEVSFQNSTYLLSALHNIQWTDNSVGQAAGENAADHALSIVSHVVNVTHLVVVSF